MSKLIKKATVVQSEQREEPSPAGEGKFVCAICKTKSFALSQALGGHMSKAHPNGSEGYAQKKLVRESRIDDRALLKRAKEHYIELYPEDCVG